MTTIDPRIARDLEGSLSEAERDALLEDMMDDGRLFEQVRTAERQLREAAQEPEPALTKRASYTAYLTHAAAVFAGVAVTALFTGGVTSGALSGASGSEGPILMASGSSIELRVNRSSVTDAAVIAVDRNETWTSLVAYPAFEGIERAIVRLSREASNSSTSAETVYEQNVGTAVDLIVVTLPTQALSPGTYHLASYELSGAGPNGISTRFRVE